MKYNPAEAYALAIGHLADRLRGGEPFVQPGRARSGCSRAPSATSCSSILAQHGYDVGEPDGRLGAKTRSGDAGSFQARGGMVPDGFASATILERLRQTARTVVPRPSNVGWPSFGNTAFWVATGDLQA